MVAVLKLAVLGSKGSGKSELTPWGRLQSRFDETIGVEPAIYSLVLPSRNTRMKLQFWEHSTSKRFDAVRATLFDGTSGAIMVWDVTDRKSFEAAHEWWSMLRSVVGDIPVLCVANKTDLQGSRVVTTDEGMLFASERGFDYVESWIGGRADFEHALVDLAEKAWEWTQRNK
jgi:GTPase SAR1 family protein